MNSAVVKAPLLELLLREGYLSSKQLTAFTQSASKSPCEWLIENRIFDSQPLTLLLSRLFQLEMAPLDNDNYIALSRKLNLRTLILLYQALPIKLESSTLTIAVYDPSSETIETDFRFATGLQTKLVLSDIEAIKTAIHSLYGRRQAQSVSAYKEIEGFELETLVELAQEEMNDAEQVSGDDAPVSRYIHQVLLDAINRGASDIHFEPYEESFRIRIRCDGILLETHSPPVRLGRRLAARVKILAQLDIAERRLPQDGRTKLTLSNQQQINIRISTLPTLWGEKIVLRLLGTSSVQLDLDQLGFDPVQLQHYNDALNQPQGLVVITGPTGSGKTLSLYAGLKKINTPHINIATAEDPVEINLPGINQVQIQPQIGFDFACALRSFLRQDPDVIMVGEIRDFETADIAVKAAQTGHLVLSTLHTNSAAETLTRLQNMGVKAYNLASSLSLVIAQRLVRRLCPMCKQSYSPTDAERQQHQLTDNIVLYQAAPTGCQHCNLGYNGRIALFEVLPLSANLKALILAQTSTHAIQQSAIENGMVTLKQSAVNRLIAGDTSISEIDRQLGWRE